MAMVPQYASILFYDLIDFNIICLAGLIVGLLLRN